MAIIKVCGLVHPDDVCCAVEAGATHVGFVFAQGRRRTVDPSLWLDLMEASGGANRVGVFQGNDLSEVVLLADLWAPQGLAWWADQGLHTGTPITMLLWWLAFADKDIGPCDVPKWLIWPLAYAAYAVARGTITGFWPYPFLNAETLGLPHLALNIAALAALFGILGLALVWIASIQRRLLGA